MRDRHTRPSEGDGPAHGSRTTRRALTLGAALRRAWVGYQRRLDQQMAAAGFADRGFPDGRVLRLCRQSEEVTASRIGRELGITRQGASKIVAALRDRGYVTLRRSSTDSREKVVRLTPRAHAYLAAQRSASRRIERDLRSQVGPEAFDGLFRLLDALGDDDQPRLRDYLRRVLPS
ncbi:MAG TPA: MarR family winged helix-turn-helix transcriptional regulator [Acidimicrobiales bacterium]|nr:MarR family winged helix-turn-helix transcriptional regulator [Acidimicrobiales bacterium]